MAGGYFLRLVSESPCGVSLKVSHQNFPCRFEFFPDKAQSNQPCSHQKLFVFGSAFLGACRSDLFCHFGKGKCQLNEGLKLPGVQSILFAVLRLVELEKAEFNCSLGENRMVIQLCVAAVVVMLVSAVIASVGAVPDVCKLCHRCRLFVV